MNSSLSFIGTMTFFFTIFLQGCAMPFFNDAVSNIKDDETVVFFRTDATYDPADDTWKVPVHGWIYEPENSFFRASLFEKVVEEKFNLEVDDENRQYFSERVNLLIADNERGKRIVIELAGQHYRLPASKPNGHFSTVLRIPAEKVNNGQSSLLKYSAVMKPGDNRRFDGEVRLLKGKGVSVISDIDDTIKHTQVTSKRDLINATFLRPFETVRGMNNWYQRLSDQGAAVHFVSSSPWQLYSPLLAMCEENGFPWASFSLKSIRFKDKTLLNLFKKGTETKPEQIRAIMDRFPERKFILVGDSGEQDPEVYAAMQKEYPANIVAIYIHNVTQETLDNDRIGGLNASMNAINIQLFEHPDEIEQRLLP